MNLTEVIGKTKQFLVEEFEIEEEKIVETALLKDDLGIDSLDFVDIVVVVENIFGFKLQSEEVKSVSTFGELCKLLQEKTENQ
ncbi:MAG: acyl carrier protein [Bacteroidales bacterium]|nr:acyl carrier protein [Bacteroidales bacterium]